MRKLCELLNENLKIFGFYGSVGKCLQTGHEYGTHVPTTQKGSSMRAVPTQPQRSTCGTQGGSHCVATPEMAEPVRRNTWFVTLYEDRGNTLLARMIQDGPMRMGVEECGKGKSKLYQCNSCCISV